MTMKQQREQGFTLVELSMSLIFIGFIILFLTSTMLSIMQTYNKGIWLDQINQAGRQINDDITDQARFSKNKVIIKSDEQRLCIGGVTYIWNTATSIKNQYSDESSLENTKLRFVRILDHTGRFCASDDMPNRGDNNVSILLSPGVTVQEFKVTEGITGLLHIQVVFSAEGIKDSDRSDQPRFYDGRYQCGHVINGVFTPAKNQYCAFAEFDIITYRRLGE